MTLFESYKEWKEAGAMPLAGLCTTFLRMFPEYANKLHHFIPTQEDIEQLNLEGHNLGYWGSGDKSSRAFELTELRETIILFICAMAEEI